MTEKAEYTSSGNRYANSFGDLYAYQRAFDLAHEVFVLTKAFPKDELYGLTDQIRRSSRSVGAQIAEAWAKRVYERSFISKIVDADGEQMETQHWLATAARSGYLTSAQLENLTSRYVELGKMLGAMMANSAKFCNPAALRLKEDGVEYLVEPVPAADSTMNDYYEPTE